VSTAAIRPARVSDADSVACLLGQLGHPTARQEAADRLERALRYGHEGVLVYELNGQVIGLVSYQVFSLLYRPHPQCRITALVVHRGARRRGVACELVQAIESLAREAGCFRLELTTRPDRHDAHRFYAELGFEDRPIRLVKRLDPP
jgi:ribosomal protein S18 acetylase RimI-like enzyme